MSMDRCASCSTLIDTDDAPESYREEFDGECLCDRCYELALEEPVICFACSGSGEGMYEGTRCSTCGGGGEIKLSAIDQDPPEADDPHGDED